MIELSAVHFAYPGGEAALADISLSVPRGQTLGLVGANGSGKSTLLMLLAGLYEPDAGSLSVAGLTSPGKSKAIRRLGALVMQEADLQIIGSTVAEDLCLGDPGGAAEPGPEAMELARRFGLDGLLDRAVHELSWGQKKRLCLAAALGRGPELLLLDEPFAGLDYPAILGMRGVIAENKARGLTQVIAAHDLEPLADLADCWAVLGAGRLACLGPAADVFDRLLEHDVRPPCSWLAGHGVAAYA